MIDRMGVEHVDAVNRPDFGLMVVVVRSSPDLVAGESDEVHPGEKADGDPSTGLSDRSGSGQLVGTATAA